MHIRTFYCCMTVSRLIAWAHMWFRAAVAPLLSNSHYTLINAYSCCAQSTLKCSGHGVWRWFYGIPCAFFFAFCTWWSLHFPSHPTLIRFWIWSTARLHMCLFFPVLHRHLCLLLLVFSRPPSTSGCWSVLAIVCLFLLFASFLDCFFFAEGFVCVTWILISQVSARHVHTLGILAASSGPITSVQGTCVRLLLPMPLCCFTRFVQFLPRWSRPMVHIAPNMMHFTYATYFPCCKLLALLWLDSVRTSCSALVQCTSLLWHARMLPVLCLHYVQYLHCIKCTSMAVLVITIRTEM